MRNNEEITTNERLQVMLAEYNSVRDNYNEVLKEYRRQTNYVNIYVTVFTGVIVFVYSSPEMFSKVGKLNNMLLAILLVFSMSILYYIYSVAIDIMYNLNLIEAQNSANEILINQEIKSEILNWDTKIVSYFNEEFVNHNFWVSPSYVVGFWNYLVLLMLTAFHSLFAFYLIDAEIFNYTFLTTTFIATFVMILQHYLMQTSGRAFVFNQVFKINNLTPMKKHADVNVLIYPIVTFFTGFFAFLVFSIKYDAFWPTSKVDIPFIFIFTMSVGDFILLPIINYKLADIAHNVLTVEKLKKYSSLILKWLIIGGVASIILNSVTHYAWAKDKYTDFMGLVPGKLTLGGWWHYWFSIFEMLIIIIFPLFWHISIKEKNEVAIRSCRNAWYFVFAFSTLMIANFIHQYLFVFDDSFLNAIVKAKFTFVPSLTAIAMYFYFNKQEKTIATQNA